MALPTYAGARAVIAAALTAGTSGWEIEASPKQKMTARTIALSIRGSDKMTHDRWLREIIVGVFVPGKNPAEALDAMEAVTPDIYTAMASIRAAINQVDPPLPITVAGDEYIAQFHLITIETTS